MKKISLIPLKDVGFEVELVGLTNTKTPGADFLLRSEKQMGWEEFRKLGITQKDLESLIEYEKYKIGLRLTPGFMLEGLTFAFEEVDIASNFVSMKFSLRQTSS